jgi:hypothetical protein
VRGKERVKKRMRRKRRRRRRRMRRTENGGKAASNRLDDYAKRLSDDRALKREREDE